MQKIWNKKQTDYLIAHYASTNTKKIATKLGFTVFQVYHKVKQLNLKKDKEFIKNESKANYVGSTLQKKYQFPKGHKPYNTGTKGLVKPNKGCFKKGNEPHNCLYDGAERIDTEGYTFVRLSKANWILKQRLIYEKHYGYIPEGMVIIFKDGNKQNFDIDNLEAITREENMQRNTIHRYPRELKMTIKLLKRVKKLINETD